MRSTTEPLRDRVVAPILDRLLDAAERGRLPDPLLRLGIRRLVAGRLRDERRRDLVTPGGATDAFAAALRESPVALLADLANAQHYEVPPAFFERVLGRRRKYSCCLFEPGVQGLDAAEEAMLALTAERAGIADGQTILELGCGWGSLSLYLAERFPRARILAVSNAKPQREHILARAAERGLANLEVETADMNVFDPGRRFDRVVSVEMFEHLRNWEEAFRRVAGWLVDDGIFFLHVFCHARFAYPFEDAGAGDWMARHFFSGGMMPSADLALHFQRDLVLDRRWWLPGTHYQRTAEAWLANLDARREEVLGVLAAHAAHADGLEAERAVGRWRLFFLACAELFGHCGGSEWGVAHYRMARR